MKISERYAAARNTSNLRSDPRTSLSPSDVLGASGMAAQSRETDLLVLGVLHGEKTAQKRLLAENMAEMLRRRFPSYVLRGKARRIAIEVLAHFLYGTCRACLGRGQEAVVGSPSLSGVLCPKCHGTGKVNLPRTDPHDWLIDQIEGAQRRAESAIGAKLLDNRF